MDEWTLTVLACVTNGCRIQDKFFLSSQESWNFLLSTAILSLSFVPKNKGFTYESSPATWKKLHTAILWFFCDAIRSTEDLKALNPDSPIFGKIIL